MKQYVTFVILLAAVVMGGLVYSAKASPVPARGIISEVSFMGMEGNIPMAYYSLKLEGDKAARLVFVAAGTKLPVVGMQANVSSNGSCVCYSGS